MKAVEITRMFEPWRAKHARTAFKPVVEAGNLSGVLSWFGGEPSGSGDDVWPICKQCQAPMRFFVQIALAEVPAKAQLPLTDGILQLFYCSTDDGSCETWEPFSGTHFARVLQEASGLWSAPAGVEPFPKKAITNWDAVQDHPHPEEHNDLGLSYDHDFKRNRVSVRCDDPPLNIEDLDVNLDVAEAIAMAEPGDKIGGWPHWIQGAEYPHCPRCQTRMALLLQVDSEDNLDYMFGDAGCAHLTYCPKHPDVLAFGWACS